LVDHLVAHWDDHKAEEMVDLLDQGLVNWLVEMLVFQMVENSVKRTVAWMGTRRVEMLGQS
jgi:hypothetical protein